MPRQNRVTPFADIIATPERGTLMGNRGVLHDDEGRIVRPWQVKRWLLCLLQFRGRKRQVMAPRHYTELFFLDEATGLAAGHRPCAECRRERFHAFCSAWQARNPRLAGTATVTAGLLDGHLHAERLAADRSKRTYLADLDELPDGVFVQREGEDDRAWLLWAGRLLAWSPGGYRERLPRRHGQRVRVLTPQSTVRAIRAGYVPAVHESAGRRR
jgi:hypothetical protein